jgi:hypothetical protein
MIGRAENAFIHPILLVSADIVGLPKHKVDKVDLEFLIVVLFILARSQSTFNCFNPLSQRDSANAGGLVFKRSGDPNMGNFGDATILKSFGEVPKTLDDL